MLIALAAIGSMAQNAKKHEFRGAWLHIIGQSQYAKMTPEETRKYLIWQLNELKADGVNAIIWQIRPQADAAYPANSNLGANGLAALPAWHQPQCGTHCNL